MKRIIAFVLLLSMALFLFSACAPVVLPPQDVDVLKEQIVADWRKQMHGASKESTHYFVTYNGYHIVALMTDTPAFHYETVEGYRFRYASGFNLHVYKQGEFMYLDEAYEKGIISKRAIAEAHRVHVEQERENLPKWLPDYIEYLDGPVEEFRLYNTENGYHIIFVQMEDAESVHTTKTIAGSEFTFTSDFFLYACNAFEFGEAYIDLEQAYNEGRINKKAIAKAAKLHAKYDEATDKYRPTEPQPVETLESKREYIRQFGPVDVFREYITSTHGYSIIYAVQQNAPSVTGVITIAGSEFKYQRAPSLCLYRSGVFTSLEEAYNEGLVSQEQIESAARSHAWYENN